MARGPKSSPQESDVDIVARAAWLHFVGGLTQNEVAERLGLSTSSAHRAIAKAQGLGFVHITVDATAAPCVQLENALIERFGLTACHVAMDLAEPAPIPLRALGAAGANWLGHMLDSGAHEVIGVSHGRTIAAVVEAMRPRARPGVTFVSLLGGLTRSLAANPYDVIHRLAQKTGAAGYLMPAPLFTDTAQDKDMLMGQSMLRTAFEHMDRATLAIVGIGDLQSSVGIAEAEQDGPVLAGALRREGAVAEILGQFLDAGGNILSTPFDGRTMSAPLGDLRGRDIVAIAGGASKVEAIAAALKSGLLTGLIIDEATARTLVGRLEGKETVAAE
ncbi:sugar-binding transcriptional regulator [Poseidonocella sp. HB161398]|uniref:sugar-binding transcriptional regulator n=1 Tax=Poseidonocella sp. HB161398 TaxID=2320855 RepID=UPI001F0D7F9E|nr:sugar-binding transcriptional regulator [Poseidonocella sp. HB161398]